MYIPPGFSTVTPYFFVAGADRFVRFLVDGLGGHETCRTTRLDGHIANVPVRIGGSTLAMEVADMPYGDRQGGIRDPHGNIWWISQRLVAEPYRP